MHRYSLFRTAGLAAVILLGFSACNENPVVTDPDPNLGYAAAVSPGILLDNFSLAYVNRDVEAYARLLDEDFAFTFRPCDVGELGLKKDHWNRQDELTSIGRMFSGRPHTREDGTVVPAIRAISLERWERRTPWTEAGDPDREGVMRATYDMKVRFVREGAGDIVVDGPSIFFAAPVSDRRGAQRYRLLGWIDRTRPCN